MSVRPATPDVARERAASGSIFIDSRSSSSVIPGVSRVSTAAVASGVTSRGARPVPPVVSTSEQPPPLDHSRSFAEICASSSGTTARSLTRSRQPPPPAFSAYSPMHATISGPERSSYAPAEARSLIVSTPSEISTGAAGGGGGPRTCAAGAVGSAHAGPPPFCASACAASSSAGVQQTSESGGAAGGAPLGAAGSLFFEWSAGSGPKSSGSSGGGSCFAWPGLLSSRRRSWSSVALPWCSFFHVRVRHPVHLLARLLVRQPEPEGRGADVVPLAQAVAAEAGEDHHVDVLRVESLLQVLAQLLERKGLRRLLHVARRRHIRELLGELVDLLLQLLLLEEERLDVERGGRGDRLGHVRRRRCVRGDLPSRARNELAR